MELEVSEANFEHEMRVKNIKNLTVSIFFGLLLLVVLVVGTSTSSCPLRTCVIIDIWTRVCTCVGYAKVRGVRRLILCLSPLDRDGKLWDGHCGVYFPLHAPEPSGHRGHRNGGCRCSQS